MIHEFFRSHLMNLIIVVSSIQKIFQGLVVRRRPGCARKLELEKYTLVEDVLRELHVALFIGSLDDHSPMVISTVKQSLQVLMEIPLRYVDALFCPAAVLPVNKEQQSKNCDSNDQVFPSKEPPQAEKNDSRERVFNQEHEQSSTTDLILIFGRS